MDLQFSDFHTIFDDFSKLLGKPKNPFHNRVAGINFCNYTKVPRSRKTPWKDRGRRDVVPGGAWSSPAATVGQRRADEWLGLGLGSP
jgi:hypothetical protein